MPINGGGTQCDGEINSNDGYKEVYYDDSPNIARTDVHETGPGAAQRVAKLIRRACQQWATTKPHRDPQEI